MRSLIMLAAVVVAAPPAWAEVRVLVGSPTGRAAQEPDPAVVNEPFAVAFDAAGRLYAAEYTRGDRLCRIADPAAAAPAVEFVAGIFRSSHGTSGGPPTAAEEAAADVRFDGLHDVSIAPDGTVYVADTFNHRVCAFDPATGRVRVVAGTGMAGFSGDGGPGREARLAGPKYVALDGAGRVLIADTENHCIRRYDPVAGTIETVAGTPPQAGTTVGRDLRLTQLDRPHGCRLDPSGRLVVADSANDRILAGEYAVR